MEDLENSQAAQPGHAEPQVADHLELEAKHPEHLRLLIDSFALTPNNGALQPLLLSYVVSREERGQTAFLKFLEQSLDEYDLTKDAKVQPKTVVNALLTFVDGIKLRKQKMREERLARGEQVPAGDGAHMPISGRNVANSIESIWTKMSGIGEGVRPEQVIEAFLKANTMWKNKVFVENILKGESTYLGRSMSKTMISAFADLRELIRTQPQSLSAMHLTWNDVAFLETLGKKFEEESEHVPAELVRAILSNATREAA